MYSHLKEDTQVGKQTKEAIKPKKNIKGGFMGLCSLAVALAELAAVYIFITQGRPMLYPIAAILGIDCAQRFATKFVR